jgi:amidase
MTDQIHYLSLLQISDLIRTRRLSCVEVCEHSLARIRDLDGALRSFVRVLPDEALATARQADREIAGGLRRGPLHGIPIGVKDLIDVAGVITGCGMEIFQDRPAATTDATVIARLRRAGAVIVGKLHMSEGAGLSHHPKLPHPVNPWSADHWTGASSSGSGVAPAAGLCFGALGSDTGGSVRHPSIACGLSGIKPTWGRVSRHGVFPLAESFDHIGPMARSTADAAAMLQVIAGEDPLDPTTLPEPVPDYLGLLHGSVAGLAIGVDWRLAREDVDSAVVENFNQAVAVFEQMGARIREVTVPPLKPGLRAMMPRLLAELGVAHEATFPAMADRYGPDLRGMIERGAAFTAVDLAKANQALTQFRGAMQKLLADIDLLLTPAAPALTPTWEELDGISRNTAAVTERIGRYTTAFNASDNPALCVPSGLAPNGTPLAIQLVGPRLSEALLLRAGHAFEGATGFTSSHPSL